MASPRKPRDGSAEEHRVLAAHLGWGRLPDINLAVAYIVEALRIDGPAAAAIVNRRTSALAGKYGTQVFDRRVWETRLRLEEMEEVKLVVCNEFDIWRMTGEAHALFGDSKLKPVYNSRSVRVPPAFRLLPVVFSRENSGDDS